MQHSEEYEEGGGANSKSGVEEKKVGQVPLNNWDLKYDEYNVVRKGPQNLVVIGAESVGVEDKDRGIRIVSKEEFKALGNQIKNQTKENEE